MSILKTIEKIVTINAVEKFAEGTAMHIANATANYMEKTNLRYVYAPQSAADYIGEHYLEVEKEFRAYGFENINLLEKKGLRNIWINRSSVDKVVKISINGRDSFKRKQRFHSNDQVVIVYQTYRN